jgi:AraC-like DNA-binding protein
VQEVAAACGYRHVGYFVRQFHARHGMPPGAWRAKKQGKTRKQG